MTNYYIDNILSSEEREVYLSIVEGIENIKSSIKVGRLSTITIGKIMRVVCLENPFLFYFQGYTIKDFVVGNYLFVEPNYIYKKKDIKKYKFQLQQLVFSKYISKLKGNNDIEKIICIHDLICDRIRYELTDYGHSIFGALINDSAVCDGISYLFKAICDCLNIECMIVDGLGKTSSNSKFDSHAWNRVKIDGVWFNIDVTFDLTTKVNEFVRHDYVFLSDYEVQSDHIFNNSNRNLCNTKNRDFYFINNLVMKNQAVFIRWLKEQVYYNRKIVEFKLFPVTKPESLINNIHKCVIKALGGVTVRYNLYPNFELNVFVLEFIS